MAKWTEEIFFFVGEKFFLYMSASWCDRLNDGVSWLTRNENISLTKKLLCGNVCFSDAGNLSVSQCFR